MTVREEIYNAIKRHLSDIPAIKHIDLWNHNVEFIEQETAWERPAVFIEFATIQWNPIVHGLEYRGAVTVNLHVVTDWTAESNVEQFQLLHRIHRILANMEGGTFGEFDLAASATNHNHEEIVENIETYTCVGIRSLDK